MSQLQPKVLLSTPGATTATPAATPEVSRTKILFIKVGILLAIISVIVIIITCSGYIAKLMMKASSCNETLGLLVTAGVLTAVVFIGLGYLFAMTESGKGYFTSGMTYLTAEEQYRYYRRQSDLLKV